MQYKMKKESKEDLDFIFSTVLDVIETHSKEKNHENKGKINENMLYLLSLFNYASKLPNVELMYEEISSNLLNMLQRN